MESATFGPVTIYRGDMRDVLPALDIKANLLLSDPPYRLTSGGNKGGALSGIFSNDRYDNNGELFPIVDWTELAPLFFSACAEDADAIVMTSDREEGDARSALLGAGFQFHRLLVWDKGTVTPNRWFMPSCEFGLYLWKGRARKINNPSSGQMHRVKLEKVSEHPTEKPVSLLWSWILNCSSPGDLVLDPFVGSGSTLVAAALAGRRAVGIELNQKWFDVSCARVEAAMRGRAQADLWQGVA